jgi:hypothetical protein
VLRVAYTPREFHWVTAETISDVCLLLNEIPKSQKFVSLHETAVFGGMKRRVIDVSGKVLVPSASAWLILSR